MEMSIFPRSIPSDPTTPVVGQAEFKRLRLIRKSNPYSGISDAATSSKVWPPNSSSRFSPLLLNPVNNKYASSITFACTGRFRRLIVLDE